MVYCVGSGAGVAMHLTFNFRCHYCLPRTAVDGMCQEKKNGKTKKREREEKKFLWLYMGHQLISNRVSSSREIIAISITIAMLTRLFQIGCGVT